MAVSAQRILYHIKLVEATWRIPDVLWEGSMGFDSYLYLTINPCPIEDPVRVSWAPFTIVLRIALQHNIHSLTANLGDKWEIFSVRGNSWFHQRLKSSESPCGDIYLCIINITMVQPSRRLGDICRVFNSKLNNSESSPDLFSSFSCELFNNSALWQNLCRAKVTTRKGALSSLTVYEQYWGSPSNAVTFEESVWVYDGSTRTPHRGSFVWSPFALFSTAW